MKNFKQAMIEDAVGFVGAIVIALPLAAIAVGINKALEKALLRLFK